MDVGCGEGRFSRMLASLGAAVTGFDPCAAFVETAARRDPSGNYLVASAEDLPFLSSHFDLVA